MSKKERRQKISTDRKMFYALASYAQHFFLNSHSLTFIRCRVVCRAQMHRLNAERGEEDEERGKRWEKQGKVNGKWVEGVKEGGKEGEKVKREEGRGR